jgi:hypothetical protein
VRYLFTTCVNAPAFSLDAQPTGALEWHLERDSTMTTPVTPLFFPEALTMPGLWRELGQTHGLTQKDFEWFSHIELASQALRDEQTPPMLAKKSF